MEQEQAHVGQRIVHFNPYAKYGTIKQLELNPSGQPTALIAWDTGEEYCLLLVKLQVLNVSESKQET